jgi:splicing factor 3A subunit 1
MVNPILTLPAPEGDGGWGGDAAQLQQSPPPPAPPDATVATHTRTIGIIHPPPDIRVIIEKTATFVAKNGPEFERRIISLNQGNAKFNFLQPSDPYHAYYHHRVSELAAAPPGSDTPAGGEPDGAASAAPDGAALAPAPADGTAPADCAAAADAKPDHSAPFRVPPPTKVLVPPKAELYTVRLPEGITGEELDIIKLTAQFVARQGKNFLMSLAQRESNNMQFHFIRPTHSMFPFFTSLTDAYSRVLNPEEGVPALLKELREGSKDLTTVLERCLNRLEWDQSQEQAKQQAEDEIEQERLQMSMIDWHDFAVVETIELDDDEYEGLPVPLTLEELKRRKRMENLGEDEAMELAEPAKEVEMEMDEEEMQLVEEGMRAARLEENEGAPQVKVADDEEPPMRIVKNYKRPEERIPAERDPTKFVVSPITGELIPISEMEEHMRISLIDPKYKEQKERMLAKIKETTLAPDDEISRNIVGLARTRPDIFGTTEEEVSNAVKAEIEKKKDEQPKQVIWDGHSGSIGWTATQALSQGGEEYNDASNVDGRPIPGPAPHFRPGMPLPQPPQPLPLANVPRFVPPNAQQYSQMSGIPQMMPHMHPPPQLSGQPPMMRMPGQVVHMPNNIPPPPGQTQFMLGPPRPYHMPLPQHMSPMMNPMGIPQPPAPPLPPQPPAEEQPPPPDEPEPKRLKSDDASLIPAEQFLAQHLVMDLSNRQSIYLASFLSFLLY